MISFYWSANKVIVPIPKEMFQVITLVETPLRFELNIKAIYSHSKLLKKVYSISNGS